MTYSTAIQHGHAPLLLGAPGHSYRRLRLAFYCVVTLVDLAAILAAFLIAGYLRFGSLTSANLYLLLAAVPCLYLCFSAQSLSANMISDWRRGVAPALGALFWAATIILTLSFWLKSSAELSRLYATGGLLLSALFLIGGRATAAQLAQRWFPFSPFSSLLLVDGLDVRAPAHTEMVSASELGIEANLADPFTLDRLARCLGGYDRVVIACRADHRLAWSSALKASSVRADLVIPELDSAGALGLDRFGDMPTVPISLGHFRIRDELAKRLLDVVLASLALLFLAPLMLLTAIAIKVGSPGPVLFTQERMGRANKLFRLYKFRSMRTEACDSAGGISTGRNDDRITGVGRFIRATSIDELPQLLNIFRGEMSFVGPRPHALGSLAGDQLFWEVDGSYYHRHACKPGLTGLAQIRGFRGSTAAREDLVRRLEADLEYVHGWSIWRDIEIIFATLKVVIHRNAY